METNREGARFCSGCGTALVRRCAHCQAELRPTAKFCDECGTSVAGSPTAPTAPAAPSPSSCVGFATMSEQPIAIRGDRLVLTICTWHDPHGFDLPLLACMEFGENGRMIANIMFDPEDLDAATAELDERHAALEAESGQ